jgi:phage repressor protein C with HTH and peptisase S24 domain
MKLSEIRLKNLKYAVSVFGYPANLAKAAGCSVGAITLILNGKTQPKTGHVRSVGNELAEKVENALRSKGVNVEEGWMDKYHAEFPTVSRGAGDVDSRAPKEELVVFDAVDIPSLFDARYPYDEIFEQFTMKLPTVNDYLRMSVKTNRMKFVTNPSDAMEPTFPKGATLILDTDVKGFQGEGVYICNLNGEMLVRRLQQVGDDLRVKADNKKYDDFTFLPKMRIVAKVLKGMQSEVIDV